MTKPSEILAFIVKLAANIATELVENGVTHEIESDALDLYVNSFIEEDDCNGLFDESTEDGRDWYMDLCHQVYSEIERLTA